MRDTYTADALQSACNTKAIKNCEYQSDAKVISSICHKWTPVVATDLEDRPWIGCNRPTNNIKQRLMRCHSLAMCKINR